MARKPSDSPYVVRDSYNHVDLSDHQSTLDHSIWFYMYKLSRALPRLMSTVGGIVTDDHG